MGLTNTFATLPGFIGPAVVGAITQGNVSVVIRFLNADIASEKVVVELLKCKFLSDIVLWTGSGST